MALLTGVFFSSLMLVWAGLDSKKVLTWKLSKQQKQAPKLSKERGLASLSVTTVEKKNTDTLW